MSYYARQKPGGFPGHANPDQIRSHTRRSWTVGEAPARPARSCFLIEIEPRASRNRQLWKSNARSAPDRAEWTVRVLEGVVTVVQEGRFLLTGDDGVTHLIILSHASWAEPDQLPRLQQQQTRLRVRCEQAPDMLAYVAQTLELVPHRHPAAQV